MNIMRDEANDLLNQKMVETGDFVEHNKLLSQLGHYHSNYKF